MGNERKRLHGVDLLADRWTGLALPDGGNGVVERAVMKLRIQHLPRAVFDDEHRSNKRCGKEVGEYGPSRHRTRKEQDGGHTGHQAEKNRPGNGDLTRITFNLRSDRAMNYL